MIDSYWCFSLPLCIGQVLKSSRIGTKIAHHVFSVGWVILEMWLSVALSCSLFLWEWEAGLGEHYQEQSQPLICTFIERSLTCGFLAWNSSACLAGLQIQSSFVMAWSPSENSTSTCFHAFSACAAFYTSRACLHETLYCRVDSLALQ